MTALLLVTSFHGTMDYVLSAVASSFEFSAFNATMEYVRFLYLCTPVEDRTYYGMALTGCMSNWVAGCL
jgi:hypothetical protein